MCLVDVPSSLFGKKWFHCHSEDFTVFWSFTVTHLELSLVMMDKNLFT